MSRLHSLTLALLAAALLPGAALADGLPVPVDDAGPSGIASADGSARYVTVPAGRGTVVERVNQRGGVIAASAFVRGTLTIPVVALDGTAGGLSHDGRTLVLIRPRSRFPRATTTFAIFGAHGLGLRRQVTLRGDFSFDALSPDGRTVYLVQYTSRTDPTHYLVRTLDPASGRLNPAPVVDPHERSDAMRGMPLERSTSADGRWQYTLYDGATGHPFIHALDTQGRRARCIDLPAFPAGADAYAYHLTLTGGGGTLTVGNRRQPFAVVDTRTFRVSTPHAAGPAAHTPASGGGGDAWPALIALALLLPLGAAAAVTRRSRRRAQVRNPA